MRWSWNRNSLTPSLRLGSPLRLLLLLPLAAAGPPEPQPPAPSEVPAVHDRMARHYLLTTNIRAAVLRGDVDAAQELGEQLSHLDPGALPDSWQPALEALAQNGRDLAVASNLEDSAKAMGQLAIACADCHEATGGGPTLSGDAAPPPAWTEDSHMPLHLWGSEWIWLGILANDDTAVRRGAEVLAGGPLLVPSPTHDPALKADEVEVHRIAREMALAPDLGTRRQLYGDLIARCGSCHRTLETEGRSP